MSVSRDVERRAGTGVRARFVHEGVPFADLDHVATRLLPFVREGLEAGEAVALVASEPVIDLVRDDLGADADRLALVQDAVGRWRGGRTTLQDLARDLRGLLASAPRVRLVEEPVWMSLPGGAEWSRYEAAVNACFGEVPCHAMCLLSEVDLPAEALADARRTHPVLWDGRAPVPSRDYVPAEEYLRPLDPPWTPRPRDAVRTQVVSRAHARALATRAGGERAEEVVLAVHELVSNALEVAPAAEVATWQEDGARVWEVSDLGPGLHDPAVGYCPVGDDATHGRGLWLVRAVADAVALRPDGPGTAVRAWFRGSA